ncbi:MAG TPA: hypothetical protein VHX88_17900 [Solirubrobacteraceae bacterium]|jgi:hypothetical protein|nr:hypothetical protein [Solirubrobacteraceae bacterium]
MTTTDYLLNGLFVFSVLRQVRERRLDLQSILLPLGIVAFVAHSYIHTVPSAGNDLVLVGLLASVGITLGVLSGLTTRVRVGDDGAARTRVGWIAGSLLIGGMLARMVFVLAAEHGAGGAISSFSATNHLTAAAWTVALVAMALCEIIARMVTVQVRAYRMTGTVAGLPIPAAA